MSPQKILIVCLCWLSFHRTEGQSLTECKHLADQLQQVGSHREAIKLYRRVVFFDTASNLSADLFYQMGNTLMALTQYEDAAECYDRSFTFQADTLKANECIFAKARSLLAQTKYIETIGELGNLPVHLPDSQERKKLFYKAVVFYFNGDLDSADTNFGKLFINNPEKLSRLHTIIHSARYIEKINPQIAKNLSYIIPGAGQLYAHDYKNAANSFLLNAGLAALFVVMGNNYSYVDAVLAVYPWLARYYKGGAKKAYLIAEKRKTDLKKQTMSNIMTLFN